MLSGRPALDWQILEEDEDEEWNAAIATASQPVHRSAGGIRKVTLLAVACLSLLLILASNVLYQRANQNLARIGNELDNAVAVENWSRQHSNADPAGIWIDPEAPQFWKTTVQASPSYSQAASASLAPAIHDFQLDGDWALVRVRIDEPNADWQTAPYYETRFYRLTDTGWLRTAPQTDIWGKETTAETEYFAFTYRQRDAGAVREVMSNLDEQYAGLRTEFGLDPIPAGEMLRVVVQPMGISPSELGLFHFHNNELIVPSPLQYPTPEGLTDADVLRSSILEPLSEVIVHEKETLSQVRCQWMVLMGGVRLWARQNHRYLPSVSQHELDNMLRRWSNIYSFQLSRLTDYSTCKPGWPYAYSASSNELRKAAARTLISYAMANYGYATLPTLIDATGEHDTWEELIPAVFEVSAEDFEKGWQAYLANEYQ